VKACPQISHVVCSRKVWTGSAGPMGIVLFVASVINDRINPIISLL
jgi:hypothetical protein